MTLKEAIEQVSLEARDETNPLDKVCKAQHQSVYLEIETIMDSGVLESLIDGAVRCGLTFNLVTLCCLVFSFGMRVQRKLDSPGRVTAMAHSLDLPVETLQ